VAFLHASEDEQTGVDRRDDLVIDGDRGAAHALDHCFHGAYPSVAMYRTLLAVSLLAAAVQGQTVSYFHSSGGAALAITAGPDGNVWFTQPSGIGRITPLGIVTSYPTPHAPAHSPIAGPNRTVWYAWSGGIDSVDVSTGAITSHSTPVQPIVLLAGPDGNIWFGYSGGIGRMTPAGSTTLFPLPG